MRTIKMVRMKMRLKTETAVAKNEAKKTSTAYGSNGCYGQHRTGWHATHRPIRLSGSCALVIRRSSGGR